MDSRLSKDLRTVSFSSSYNFYKDFIVNAGGRYDLTSDQTALSSFGFGFSTGLWEYKFQEYLREEREKFSLSAVYDDECTPYFFV